MPIYTYACESCHGTFETRQSFSDAPLRVCEQCGGSLRKVIHPVGIVFKGSGWYATDSRASINGNGAKSGATSEAGKGETPGASGESTSGAGEPAPAAASGETKTAPATSGAKE